MASSTSLLIICFVAVGCIAYPLDNKEENESFRPVSLPIDFGSYDPNANGYIDLEELAKVTGTTLDDARKPFMDADIDDDNQISPSEFVRAPWSLKVQEDFSLREQEDDDDNKDFDGELTTLNDDSNEGMSVDLGEKTLGSDENGPVTFETEEPTAPELIDDVVDDTPTEDLSEDNEDDVGEPFEEEDDESHGLDNDEEDDESEDEDEDSEIIDPLLNDDNLLREQDNVASEDEFVENAIY